MSAFVPNKGHIDAMVRAGLRKSPMEHGGGLSWYWNGQREHLNRETANRVGQMLVDEVVRSVRHRYQGDTDAGLPGPHSAYWTVPYLYDGSLRETTGVEVASLVFCYEYQACETPDWQQSEAYEFCVQLVRFMWRLQPGFSDAAWEWKG